jgi:hypothetical protein
MLSIALFGFASAACVLSATIDPNGGCVMDPNGFSTLDADSDSAIPISLEIVTKAATEDHTGAAHPATVGALTDDTATDGRYILACKQAAGVKTVQLNVNRPAAITAFGGEWVQLFPKDSWENTTNEYEPFTFNDYGAKVPLQEFRPTDSLSNVAPTIDVLNVFMEVKDEGDYEVKFGNPNIVSGGKWVAVEFKSTLLRVGSPWAECSGDVLGTESTTVGAIMPVLYGHPNLHSIALKDGFPSYDTVISELSGTTVEVKVVLEIFSATTKTYTDSATDGQCYKAGNACPEAHLVCKAEYCEIDVWKSIIADLQAASPGKVTVLGSVGAATTVAEYAGLGLDGFYFVGPDADISAEFAAYTGTSVRALGSPLFDETAVDDATVYVTLSADEIGLWNPFSWYPYVAPSKWAAIVTSATDTSDISTLIDRGYGYVFVTSEAGFDSASSLTASVLSALSARRLSTDEGRRLEASAPFWGCDDTLFECKPICMKQMGTVTSKVSDTLCAAAPLDQCSCKCLHEAQWTCEGDSIVCKAKYGAGDLETVGDKVCETRGAPKPTSIAELRIASQCEPITEMRGSAPTSDCLAQWGTPEPTTKAPTTEAAPTTPATQAPETKEEETNTDPTTKATETGATPAAEEETAATEAPATPKPIVIAESFAAAMAFAALAIHA